MFLLLCSRWVLRATLPSGSRLRRRRSPRRHGTRVSPRHSSERRRQVVRAIEACSCSCCSAPSDRNRSDDRSPAQQEDRKSTRLNSSHVAISYAVFCLKKKKKKNKLQRTRKK